jgi:Spy/CpxP family protein refolding chaperone
MRPIRPFALAAALLLGAAPAAAQDDGPPPRGAEMLERREQRPFDMLMEVRGELGLSDAQVGRLQSIADRLEETNRPLREELLRRWQAVREERRAALMRMTPEQRQAELRRVRGQRPPPVPESLRPLVHRMRRNIGEAMREAGTVLTPRQKARARELMRERRGGRMGPEMRRGPGMGGRPPRAHRP